MLIYPALVCGARTAYSSGAPKIIPVFWSFFERFVLLNL